MGSAILWETVGLTAAVVNLGISFLVYIRKDYVGYRPFAGISLCLSLWHFCHVMVYPSYTDPFWMRVLFSSLMFIPALGLAFTATLLEKPALGALAPAWAAAGAGFLISAWTPVFKAKLWGIAFILFEFPVLFYCLACVFLATLRAESPERRNGLVYFCVASSLAILGGFAEFLPRLGVRVPDFPFGSASIAAYVLLVAYAIRRHRLLDIRSALNRGLALGSIALLVGAFSSAVYYLARAFPQGSGATSLLFFYFSSLGILLIWERWGEWLKELFFSEERMRGKRTEDWMRTLPRTLELEQLLRSAEELLANETRADGCAVALLDARAKRPNDRASVLRDFFAAQQSPVTATDLRWRVRTGTAKGATLAQIEAVLEYMTEHHCEVLVPVITGEGPQALLRLGERQGGFYDSMLMGWLRRVAACLGQGLADFKIRQQLLDSDRLVQLGLLSGGIAHEIRNPLTYMKGAAYVLQTTDLNVAQKLEIATNLGKEIDRLNRLVEDLLSFAKPHRSADAACDICAELDAIVKIIRANLERPIELEWRRPAESIAARIDADHLKQIVINLIRNAQLAMTETKRGSRIRVEAAREDSSAVLRVSDDGPGIPKEVADKLFQVFASGSTSGTGFGLNIVDKLVRLYQGEITVSTEPGRGTAFSLRFPAAAAPSPAVKTPTPKNIPVPGGT